MPGYKHLVQCHCVLPQYRKLDEPIFHKFIVYSKIDAEGEVVPKLVKCNNCEVVHKVVDYCRSEISFGIDESLAISSIEDIKDNIPEKISNILLLNKCDISIWEHVDDIIFHKEWGTSLVISRHRTADSTQVKLLTINDIDKFRVETHLRNDSMDTSNE
jgi:hypothetical protein